MTTWRAAADNITSIMHRNDGFANAEYQRLRQEDVSDEEA